MDPQHLDSLIYVGQASGTSRCGVSLDPLVGADRPPYHIVLSWTERPDRTLPSKPAIGFSQARIQPSPDARGNRGDRWPAVPGVTSMKPPRRAGAGDDHAHRAPDQRRDARPVRDRAGQAEFAT
jgi:hypothetical protein